MPGKKKKTTTVEQQIEEPIDPQQAAFKRLLVNLTSTFEKGFEKLQQALINNMAPQPAPPMQTTPAQQQPNSVQQGYNTRNKALRPL